MDYEALLAERDAKIAELEGTIAEAAKSAEAAEALRVEMDELRRQGEEQRVEFELTMAGARNVKAARVLLDEHDDHVENVGVSKVDEGTAAAQNSLQPRNGFKRKATAAMDASRQLPTHGDGLLDMRELARTLLESMVDEMMGAQADMLCGDGANARNGYRERGPATPVGDITLRIPKLGAGTYFPEGVIERYSRTDRAAAAAVAESWANGVSTGKMERIARKMGMERLSRDRVGAMCRSLDAEVGEPASRDPGGIEVNLNLNQPRFR